MQIVEIPRRDGEYKKADKSRIDLFTAEDHVRIATLFDIHRENSEAIYASKNNLSPISNEDREEQPETLNELENATK